MTLVCSPGFVAMPTVAELKGPRFCGSLRTFPRSTGTASVTAPAGARAGPDGHMMSPADQPGGRLCGEGEGEGDQFICTNTCITAPGLSVCCPLVCVDELSAALLSVPSGECLLTSLEYVSALIWGIRSGTTRTSSNLLYCNLLFR